MNRMLFSYEFADSATDLNAMIVRGCPNGYGGAGTTWLDSTGASGVASGAGASSPDECFHSGPQSDIRCAD